MQDPKTTIEGLTSLLVQSEAQYKEAKKKTSEWIDCMKGKLRISDTLFTENFRLTTEYNNLTKDYDNLCNDFTKAENKINSLKAKIDKLKIWKHKRCKKLKKWLNKRLKK